ncbi:hypothetical protein [Actinoplanes sp. NPDC049599]|uniref:hypothetical protein n=1 Tax=Actinoplanes sp. NPDC049599 TaxID=3363903 RepID=UPI0037B9E1C2
MTAAGSDDLARVAARLRSEIGDSTGQLRTQLAADMRRLSRSVEKQATETGKRIDATDERLDALVAEHAEFRRQVQRGLRELALRAARIEGECQLLEGLLRRQHGIVPVDLDAVPAAFRSLVADVREAERLRSSLLDDDARAARRRRLELFEDRERELARTRQRALDASRALAAAKPGGWAFHRAAGAYRKARTGLREQEEALVAAQAQRDAAEQELRRDATRQQEFRAHPGATVTDRLAGYVRDRIDTAVAEHELFPAWFTTVLGHRPLPARAAEWREAAIQLVLYRITYEVTDAVVALGPPPESGHRLTRHDAVQAALRRLDAEGT